MSRLSRSFFSASPLPSLSAPHFFAKSLLRFEQGGVFLPAFFQRGRHASSPDLLIIRSRLSFFRRVNKDPPMSSGSLPGPRSTPSGLLSQPFFSTFFFFLHRPHEPTPSGRRGTPLSVFFSAELFFSRPPRSPSPPSSSRPPLFVELRQRPYLFALPIAVLTWSEPFLECFSFLFWCNHNVPSVASFSPTWQ